MKKTIAILEGDGIGPEIMAEAEKVLAAVEKQFGHEFELEKLPFGGAALDLFGEPFPESTRNACDKAHAILKGPVGGPKYERIVEPWLKPEIGGVLALRKRYDTFANYRPVMLPKELLFLSPLENKSMSKGIDIMIVRELLGGIYFGEKKHTVENGKRIATDVMEYTEPQIERIAREGFREAAKRKKILHNIHKANVLECSRLWNEVVERVGKTEFPEIKLQHMLVDNAACQLVLNPWQFDVMLMENMMGDILSDIGGGIIGSLGLMPSACVGKEKSYYEPSHGSAPGIAGKGIANPFSMIGSVALMLQKSFGLEKEARSVWNSLFEVMQSGTLTLDLWEIAKSKGQECRKVSTKEFGELVAGRIGKF